MADGDTAGRKGRVGYRGIGGNGHNVLSIHMPDAVYNLVVQYAQVAGIDTDQAMLRLMALGVEADMDRLMASPKICDFAAKAEPYLKRYRE